jgi:hypothetical protein
MIAHMVVLAETSLAGVIIWCVVLIAALIAGLVFALRLKRRYTAEDDAPATASGFTLSDLRQMHKLGQLTDEEFERAKEKVVAAAKKAAERKLDPAVPIERDSADAIRARRLAREAQEFADDGKKDPTG